MNPLPHHLDSDALRANLARTAQDVCIPEQYQELITVVEGFYGVRTCLSETLSETFHQYRNIDTIIESLQTLLLRHWSHFDRPPQREHLFELLADLSLRLFEDSLSATQASSLLRTVCLWATSTLEGSHGSDYEAVILDLAHRIGSLRPRYPEAFRERSPQLRNMTRRCLNTSAEKPMVQLLRSVLEDIYSWFGDHLDVLNWIEQENPSLKEGQQVLESMEEVSRKTSHGYIQTLPQASSEELASDMFPTYPDLVDRTLRGLARIQRLSDRFTVGLFILKDDTLGHRQREVLNTLLSVVRTQLTAHERPDFVRPIETLTLFFRQRTGLYPEMRFRCYQAIGEAIGESSNLQAAELLTEHLMAWPFEYPEIMGATEEWETLVNPLHLMNIRCWMRIVESNPVLFERLAAALTLQLRLGGVFIADTDLFQRDISRLLASPIEPIYAVIKQLLRSFPVFYNEVGAEGELRSVSTELDEICGREDSLMHFLRKQVHAESSNRLVRFSRTVLEYWANLDSTPLRNYLPESTLRTIAAQHSWAEEPHQLLLTLCGPGGILSLDELVEQTPEALDTILSSLPSKSGTSFRRVQLLVRLHQLLVEKYSLDSEGPDTYVQRHLQIPPAIRFRFQQTFDAWKSRSQAPEDAPGKHDSVRHDLIDANLDILDALRSIILSSDRTEPIENLLHKRHLAAGIPSIYGNYTEPKFDALGLTFRMERLLSTLLEEEVVHARLEYITGATLRQMARTVARFERALAVDGILSQSISDNLELLESSFEGPSLSFHQYQNIFQFLATNISDLARLVVLCHDQALRRILSHDSRPLQNRRLDPDALAETLLRELLTSGIGLQNLDRYVSTAVRRISTLTDRLDSDALTRMMSYDPDRLVIWIHDFDSTLDNQITLGSKALSLCRLAANGHRVPLGFILSTELFRTRRAMTFKPFYQDTLLRIRRAIQELENQLDLQLGNPDSLLMLSIRSGAAISMPGQMSTFINVGLNPTLVEEFGQRTGHQWMAWDSYRRYLQSWAMSEGVVREEFDTIMSESKDRFGVDKKHELAPEQMREIALDYKLRAEELGVIFDEDPFEQIVQCVFKVLDSWEAPQARDFRRYTGMAEDWGTAVVVQHMVHGNLSHDSGAGVTFTRNPQQPQSRKIRLFGDFAIRSQGEDLVGGLVFPLPISEAQRQQIPAYQGVENSLERNFPEIFAKLNEVASQLVSEHNHDDLEIEFTFVSPRGEDLFLLQKRPMITEFVDEIPQRNGSTAKDDRLLGLGLGVAGGFFQGRVAIDLEQIEQLIADSPEEPIILLRPDTVPEDLSMIVRAGGLLTARGGSTSHAAVTAKRLGKVAVVDCRTLQVIENEGIGLLGDTKLSMGDWISIDGRTGHIYRGCLLPTNKTGKTETP